MNLQKGGFSYFILNHFSNAIDVSYFKQKKKSTIGKVLGSANSQAM